MHQNPLRPEKDFTRPLSVQRFAVTSYVLRLQSLRSTRLAAPSTSESPTPGRRPLTTVFLYASENGDRRGADTVPLPVIPAKAGIQTPAHLPETRRHVLCPNEQREWMSYARVVPP